MKITFNFANAFEPGSTKVANAYTLNAMLEMLVTINISFLRENPKTPALYESGVRYGRTLIWEPIPALYLPNKRKWVGRYYAPGELGGEQLGDCKSLSPARAAEIRLSGRKAILQHRFRDRPNDDGRLDFHILLLTDNGYEDPSRVLGMK